MRRLEGALGPRSVVPWRPVSGHGLAASACVARKRQTCHEPIPSGSFTAGRAVRLLGLNGACTFRPDQAANPVFVFLGRQAANPAFVFLGRRERNRNEAAGVHRPVNAAFIDFRPECAPSTRNRALPQTATRLRRTPVMGASWGRKPPGAGTRLRRAGGWLRGQRQVRCGLRSHAHPAGTVTLSSGEGPASTMPQARREPAPTTSRHVALRGAPSVSLDVAQDPPPVERGRRAA